MGEGGFEPPKSVTTDLQSVPFGRSGTLPNINEKRAYRTGERMMKTGGAGGRT